MVARVVRDDLVGVRISTARNYWWIGWVSRFAGSCEAGQFPAPRINILKKHERKKYRPRTFLGTKI